VVVMPKDLTAIGFEPGPPFTSPLLKLIGRWQTDYVDKLKQLQKLKVENRKSRVEQEEQIQSFLKSLLRVLDDYDRLLQSIQAALSAEDEKALSVLKNFAALRKQFSMLLKKLDVQLMTEVEGDFVAGLHTAAGAEASVHTPEVVLASNQTKVRNSTG
jgi:molecular chaperone GrpE (heat shock protein)